MEFRVPPDLLAQGSLLTGVAGLALVAWGAPRRSSPAAIALWLGFTSLAASGALGLGSVPDLDAGWSAVLLLAALLLLGLAGGLAVLEFRSRARALLLAMSETESLRREVARTTGINVRLEDELREFRRQLQAGQGARSGQLALLESTVAHQRHTLEVAHEKLRRHRALFDGAVEGIVFLERETLRVAEANSSFCRMAARTPDDLAKLSLPELFADGPVRPGRADLQRSAREARALPASIERSDGHVVPVELTVAAVGDASEAVLFAIVRDASERRTAERDAERAVVELTERTHRLESAAASHEERTRNLEAANARLAELQERKDQHLTAVAHELRTPLTSIRSFSEILLRHEDAEPEIRREFLGIVQRESERLTRLVNNVLDLARIESGTAKLATSEFDARDVLADAAATVRGAAAEAQVEVVVDVGASPRTLRADRDRVQQLLVNLLANAIKFSPAGARVEAVVGGEAPGGRVSFEVRDHGRGIPKEDQARIFERYQRVEDASSPARAGTGLGLAISREIVQLHGGTLGVESAIDRGSTFRAEFPGLVEARARAAAPPPPRPVPVASAPAPERLAPLPREAPPPPRLPTPQELDLMSTTGTLPPLGGR